jgi:acyl-CoA dehydrogenase
MEFSLSPVAAELQSKLLAFMEEHVYPAEAELVARGPDRNDPHAPPAVLESLKAEARRRGLWNLFLPYKTEWTQGLSNIDYAPLAEIMGRSHLGPQACNCSAPDTGNMEILNLFGTDEQKERWLVPLLEGEIRSCFSMTEPDVASSDATNISCAITTDGDDYVINGTKWWSSGAMDPRCKVAIVMGKTDPEASPHRQQSMVLVPLDTPGLEIVRNLTVFGYTDQEGHAEIRYNNVRVPRSNLLGEQGGGFAIAQARLGPGRIHHCMRALGAAERALELMCKRALSRQPFGKPLAEQGVIQTWIADTRLAVDQARLYTFYAAWLMDTAGNKAARTEISGIKVAAINAATEAVDRAIQVHGAAGVGPDTPLPLMYAHMRSLHFADGPEEVHRRSIAQRELRKHQS